MVAPFFLSSSNDVCGALHRGSIFAGDGDGELSHFLFFICRHIFLQVSAFFSWHGGEGFEVNSVALFGLNALSSLRGALQAGRLSRRFVFLSSRLLSASKGIYCMET